MNTANLVFDLQRESIRARSGTGIVSVLAIVSLTIGSAIAFLVAGGTWMFWQRAQHVEEAAPALKEAFGNEMEAFLYPWFALALLACAFILPALFNLTAQAAVLGASGREQRLATLRLLGLSSRQVERMAIVETGLQAIIGIVLGGLISLLIAPVFTQVDFQMRSIAVSEILLPWWGYLAVAGVLFLLAIGAALVGMRRVRVSPLGVAKRQIPAAYRWWRAIVFLIIAGIGGVLLFGKAGPPTAMVIMVMFGMVMSINLISPFILQLGAHILSLFPGTAHFVACQRVAGNARPAWKRSAAIGFFGYLAGFLVAAPLGSDALAMVLKEDPGMNSVFKDISTGVLLTLIFGFTLTTMSIILGQVSGIFEDKELIRSLDLMGVPRGFQFRSGALTIMGPVVGLSFFGFLFGGGIASLMFFSSGDSSDVDVVARLLMAFSFLAVGWLVTLLAVVLVEPLRGYVLRTGGRKE